MPNVYEGELTSSSGRFAIVVSRYNESVTGKLHQGAVECLASHGVADDAIDVAWAPGAFEIPMVADRMASSGRYAAVICLGAVIRGETMHDQHINRAVSDALMSISLRTGVPCLFGVLTCQSLEQAIQRSGGRKGNKGAECASAALLMANLLPKLPSS
ncbi:MAG: 6,7-dimethyl-8-ribityllumazine synthase [Planctomycetales bacterium]